MSGKYDPREIRKAMRLHRALSSLVEKYDLQGFTIRCFDLLDSLQTTACLSLAMFNDMGIVATCEGDVPAMLSMYLARRCLGKPSFQANPSEIDVEKSEILLAHCTLPLSLTREYALTSHYESGIGVAVKGEMPLGPCFVFRLSPDLDRYVLLRGEVVENLSRANLCRTQIRVRILDDTSYFLTRPLGNHHMVVYGDDAEGFWFAIFRNGGFAAYDLRSSEIGAESFISCLLIYRNCFIIQPARVERESRFVGT